VTLEHEHGVAAVVRDRGGDVWLGDPEPGTMLKDFAPGVQGLLSDVTLAGGLLPSGAVAAVAWDRAGGRHDATCGDGAWLALLPGPVRGESPLVRFLDPADELVAVPLPAAVKVEPVPDAGEPCPVCRAAEWARVVAAPSGRYGHDGAGRPTAAVCRRCGREENLGVLFAAASDDPPAAEALAESKARVEREMAAYARTARFDLYGLAGHEPTVAGHGSHNGQLDSVTLAFATAAGDVTVETSVEDPWMSVPAQAHDALEWLLHERDSDPPQGSETAISLWINGRQRAHAGDAWSAQLRELALSIDGRPTAFALAAHGERFAAVARPHDATITVTGHGDPTGLALEKVRLGG
jgi:hypothetical protein